MAGRLFILLGLLRSAVKITGTVAHRSVIREAAPPTLTGGGVSSVIPATAGDALLGRRDFVSVWPPEASPLARPPFRQNRFPCEDAPEQPHCQQPEPSPDPSPDPDPPQPQPQPTNDISSTSLTPDQVHQAFYQIPYGSLVELVASFGEDTSGKSQADLVAVAWSRFEASMGNLDIGQVDAAASLANFEQGQGSWVYYGDKIAPST
ncbi:MAG: hypothetical protein Q9201_000962 [Fulgogasparrea decipioides]